nr:adenosylcobinamide amidohydrolase [uncultured Marinifilum sp.]
MEFKLGLTDDYFHVEFAEPVKMLSSAILNGGFQYASHFLNAKVDANFNGERTDFESPEISLDKLAKKNNWTGNCVGMMTAAYMKSFRSVKIERQGVWIEALVTAGVSNARRAGDLADYQFINEECEKLGTINILILTNAELTEAAMVESLMILAEAKAACMQDLNIKSRASNTIATGTGTDSAAIACGKGAKVKYCGKHVLFGEILAKAVIQAISQSLQVVI